MLTITVGRRSENAREQITFQSNTHARAVVVAVAVGVRAFAC